MYAPCKPGTDTGVRKHKPAAPGGDPVFS